MQTKLSREGIHLSGVTWHLSWHNCITHPQRFTTHTTHTHPGTIHTLPHTRYIPYHSLHTPHTLPSPPLTPYCPHTTIYTQPTLTRHPPTLTLLGKVSTTIEVPSMNANGQCIAPGHQLDLIVGAEGILQSSGSAHRTSSMPICVQRHFQHVNILHILCTYVCVYNIQQPFSPTPYCIVPLSPPHPPLLPSYTLTSTFNPESVPG